MIPLEFIQEEYKPILTKFDLNSLKYLMLCKSKRLDIFCNGITKRDDFIYPAEEE
jgi:hypothetical protein